MSPKFYICISLNLPLRKISYGKFLFGKNRDCANEIFALLTGKRDANHNKAAIQIELMEEFPNLPVTLGAISCSIDELKDNVSIITKEIFRLSQLENRALDIEN